MFIGAGNASTGGGIKTATFAVLGWAIRAELRGDPDITPFHRRVGASPIGHALARELVGMGHEVLGVDVEDELVTRHRDRLTEPHRQILVRVGADHTVLPDADTGRRVAHLVSGNALSDIAAEENFVITESAVPKVLVDQPLSESQLRRAFGVTIIALRRPGGPFVHAEPDAVPEAGDIILTAGQIEDVEAFTGRG